jgi:hypothetical protein
VLCDVHHEFVRRLLFLNGIRFLRMKIEGSVMMRSCKIFWLWVVDIAGKV